MKKMIKRLQCLLCYVLVFTMLLPAVTPSGTVYAAGTGGLNTKKVTILVGEETSLSLQGDTIASVKSKDAEIASVAQDGTVTGKKAGKTTVTLKGSSGRKYKCKVTVKVGLSKEKVYVSKGGKTKVQLCGSKVKSVSSKKKKVAKGTKKKNTVTIKGLKKGSTRLKVKGKNGKAYYVNVVVENPKISKKSVILAKGDKGALSVENTKQAITWKSASEKVVRVDENGQLESVAAGTASVVAADESGKKYSCEVTVEEPKMAASQLNLNVDQSIDLVLAGNSQQVSWKTTNKSIANVNEKGKVTAISNGIAYISATVESGASFECRIEVTDQSKSGGKSGKGGSGDQKDGKSGSGSVPRLPAGGKAARC